MKKRLIALCLALAFVLAALPGNLVSLAADSIGDLAGDEAAGVWGDFSDWVVMYEEGSFKEESVTLYYNPGTQPNNTVTLTGEDVPASFLVEYMLPLTAADGTVSYWYVVNTDEWEAFAGADVCPPYVRVEDVTDLTYLEVQGAADGVFAEFEAVDASTAPEQVDTSHMSGVTSIRGYDISLKDENGATWQPKDNGTTVTVRVYDAWDITVENPIVDIYHVHGDGTVEVLSNTTGAVTLWPDGSVSFETDSFSNYYVVLGFADESGNGWASDGRIDSGDNINVYVEPGQTISFSGANTTASWTPAVTDINASGRTVVIGADAPLGSYTYTVTWGSSRATVVVHVSTRQQIVAEIVKDTEYPIILSMMQGASQIPSEPGYSSGSYTNIGQGTNGYTTGYGSRFASSGQGIIDPRIADLMVASIDGSNVIGYADATGQVLKQYLSGIDWDGKMMDLAIARNWKALDGTEIEQSNRDQFEIVPYVLKLMTDGGTGWHIDCAIVRRSNVTLSYDVNLDNYVVTGTKLQLPDSATVAPGKSTSVGSISGLGSGGKVTATHPSFPDNQYTLTFLGWDTKPDGTGTRYAPGATISINENTTLYAIWQGAVVPGELYIYKDVTAQDGITAPTGVEYEFTVTFGTVGNYTYTVYDASNAIKATGTVNTSGKIKMQGGWYAVFKDIPANTTYTVTEATGSYDTTATGDSGSIRSGGRAVARFTNKYLDKDVTINYVAGGNGSVAPGSETIKEVTGIAAGSTATPNVGYKFMGWYNEKGDKVSENATFVPEKVDGKNVAATYTARFEEIKVEIKYEVDGPADCGTVSPTQQTVGVVSGTPASTAAASSNVYKFVGWYDKDGNLLSTDATYKPAKNADGLHVAATYYAKFEYNLTSLTIVKDGCEEELDLNQTFIFNISGNGVDLDVTVHGNGSVTIDGLTVGAQYTITEKTDWSWRYQCTGWTHTNGGNGKTNVATITLGLDGTITFTNERPNKQWLDGDSWCDNIFGQSAN